MVIDELLDKRLILFDELISSKDELFDKVSLKLEQTGKVTKAKGFKKDLYKREKEASTGIEDGFGIPHAKSRFVTAATIVFAHTGTILDYRGLDEQPIEWVFMIAVPHNANNLHLDILSALSRRLMDQDFRDSLKAATSSEQVLNIMNERRN